jgi:hypothetical protein
MHVPQHLELLNITQIEHEPSEIDKIARANLDNLYKKGYILGAFPFGSVQTGDHSSLSDYDVAIMIPETDSDRETEIFQAIHDAAKQIYTQTSTPLEVSLHTDVELKTGRHDFPHPMVDWLREQRFYNPRTIGEDFIMDIAHKEPPTPHGIFGEMDRYTKQTRYRMKKAWFQGVYSDPHELLGTVLGTPHVSTRKTIDTFQRVGLFPEMLHHLDHESIYMTAADLLEEDGRAAELYHAISADKRTYESKFLYEAANLSSDEYDQIVMAVLEEDLPMAIELLRRLQDIYYKFDLNSGYYHKAMGLC